MLEFRVSNNLFAFWVRPMRLLDSPFQTSSFTAKIGMVLIIQILQKLDL